VKAKELALVTIFRLSMILLFLSSVSSWSPSVSYSAGFAALVDIAEDIIGDAPEN